MYDSRRALRRRRRSMARRVVIRTRKRANVGDFGAIGPVPAQPGLLHHVLGLGQAAEHPVGDRDQERPVRLERLHHCHLIGHAPTSTLWLILDTRRIGGQKRDIGRADCGGAGCRMIRFSPGTGLYGLVWIGHCEARPDEPAGIAQSLASPVGMAAPRRLYAARRASPPSRPGRRGSAISGVCRRQSLRPIEARLRIGQRIAR